jgi:hypothetical protein
MMPDFVYVLTLSQYGQPQWVTVHPTREGARSAWTEWTDGEHTEDDWERGWWTDGEDYEAHLAVADFIKEVEA